MSILSKREIEACNLSFAEAGLLAEASWGTFNLREWAELWYASSNIHTGFALGIQEYHSLYPYEAACEVFSLRNCHLFCSDFGITGSGNVKMDANVLMTTLTKEVKPSVFFVPPKLRTYSSADKPGFGHTKAEMEWCLEHQDRINNMYFVFGLYNVKPEGVGVAEWIFPHVIQNALIRTLASMK